MALENRLELRLSQKLILTPQLQQAIKLLQMPQLELSQSINQELVENPFLEEIEEPPDERIDALEKETSEDSGIRSADDAEVPFDGLRSFDVDDYFDARSSDGRDVGYFTPGTVDQSSFEQLASKEETLFDHLLWQLRLSDAPDKIKKIGESVIGNIDENGYLCASDQDIADRCDADLDETADAIKLVQSFDPVGVGSRTLRECILIQIKSLGLSNDLFATMMENHIPDLERKNYRKIAKALETPVEDILSAVHIIEGLEPKPGRNFVSVSANYIVPDVFIEKTETGHRIILNEDGVPKLRLNKRYRNLLSNKNKLSKEDKAFLDEKLRSAVWLMKSLDQRNKTIYKVTKSILDFQIEFFDNGAQFLKPLNLRDVAEDIDMHESTVSRVTSNKYLSCSHGIFNFRHFFSSAVHGNNGNVSSTIVKEAIKKLITEEDPRKPYSDLKIAELIKKKDISIARRTVAKYREELKIPPHNKRKLHDFK